MSLRDALAAALGGREMVEAVADWCAEHEDPGEPLMVTNVWTLDLLSFVGDRLAADPAFREALVEAVAEAEAMHPLDGCEWAEKYRSDARAIVERMLP